MQTQPGVSGGVEEDKGTRRRRVFSESREASTKAYHGVLLYERSGSSTEKNKV